MKWPGSSLGRRSLGVEPAGDDFAGETALAQGGGALGGEAAGPMAGGSRPSSRSLGTLSQPIGKPDRAREVSRSPGGSGLSLGTPTISRASALPLRR